MKQKESIKSFNDLPKLAKITTIVIGVVILGVIASIYSNGNKQENIVTTTEANNSAEDSAIQEAQIKCMLMEESDIVNYMGEQLSEKVVEKARKHCLSLWDTPEKESDFETMIMNDWELEKNERLNGYTLQELYDEASK